MPVLDCDQHLYESRTLWRDRIDPAAREVLFPNGANLRFPLDG